MYDDDVLSDLRADEKNRAKELIEDFMIAANGVTAQVSSSDKGFASMRRVLRSPERWERIVALAGTFGERLPAVPDAGALNAFLEKRCAADPVRFPDVSLSVVKLLGRGEYAVELPGRGRSKATSALPSTTTRTRRHRTGDFRTSSPSGC